MKFYQKGVIQKMSKTNIIPFLYNAATTAEIIKLYAEELRNNHSSWENLLHANLLQHYAAITEDSEFATSVQKMITDFYYEVIHHYKVRFKGRKKALIKTEDKINLQIFRQKKDPNYSAELNDSLAFRLILAGSTIQKLTYDCYRLMDKCIEFFLNYGFTPVRSEPVFDIEGFDITKFANLYVPNKTLLPANNIRYVKDYILHPKSNGYQSLHILFQDAIGRIFEIQIRTTFMDAHAEYGLANHSVYKDKKYQDEISYEKVDVSKININQITADSFILTNNEKIPYYDGAGILEHRTFLELSNF